MPTFSVSHSPIFLMSHCRGAESSLSRSNNELRGKCWWLMDGGGVDGMFSRASLLESECWSYGMTLDEGWQYVGPTAWDVRLYMAKFLASYSVYLVIVLFFLCFLLVFNTKYLVVNIIHAVPGVIPGTRSLLTTTTNSGLVRENVSTSIYHRAAL